MDWKEEVKRIVMGGCTDSDIKEYIEGHPGLNWKDVWGFVFDLEVPENCKGCRYVKMSGMYPCNACSRNPKLQDFYEKQ